MCLVVEKKYELNQEERIAYKVLYRAKKGLVTFYLFTPIVNKRLRAEGSPNIVSGHVDKYGNTWKHSFPKDSGLEPCQLLERGCIHCFLNEEDMISFFSCYEGEKEIEFYKVMGRGIIAEGKFEGVSSICFKEIELLEQIKLGEDSCV